MLSLRSIRRASNSSIFDDVKFPVDICGCSLWLITAVLSVEVVALSVSLDDVSFALRVSGLRVSVNNCKIVLFEIYCALW